MKLPYILLGLFFNREIITLQQIADNTSLSVQEVLDINNILTDINCIEYKEGSVETDIVKAKINGAGKIQYWKGVLSNV